MGGYLDGLMVERIDRREVEADTSSPDPCRAGHLSCTAADIDASIRCPLRVRAERIQTRDERSYRFRGLVPMIRHLGGGVEGSSVGICGGWLQGR